ncbi:hypothetical protein TNCV_109081 [Trichonephila clavipes]|nr:hypothetical protein TNCV_109081 [Trichonephila clavipes]
MFIGSGESAKVAVGLVTLESAHVVEHLEYAQVESAWVCTCDCETCDTGSCTCSGTFEGDCGKSGVCTGGSRISGICTGGIGICTGGSRTSGICTGHLESAQVLGSGICTGSTTSGICTGSRTSGICTGGCGIFSTSVIQIVWTHVS